jgi:heterodisulfide reductase subunit A
MKPKIGVYICHCGTNIASKVDVPAVVEYAKALPYVAVAREYKFMCSEPGQDMIRDDIRNLDLNRVVVASCSPLMHEPTFRKTCQSGGLNGYLIQMANIREHCSWVTDDHTLATEKAKRLVSAAVSKARLLEPLEPRFVDVNPNVLIVGAGIAGIQAALDIANAGNKVYLVEKEPCIGGHMAQFDKTFPTLDCAACILTPKMVQVGQHENIEIMACSEVEEVSGYIGNFKAKVRRHATFVDWDKCNGCAECVDTCPVEVASEFDLGLGRRHAIYRPFPQAVPNRFSIDKRGLAPCRYACPAGVNAQGYITLISKGKHREALELERQENPLASICGRVCTHPCERECARGPYDGALGIRNLKRFIADNAETPPQIELPSKRDERIAVVGAGPAGLSCAYHLARRGYQVKVFDSLKAPGGMLIAGIPRFRLPQSAIDADVNYIKSWGVEIELGKTLGKDFTISGLFSQGYRAVFLGIGAWKEIRLGINGEDLEGVIYCIDFLKKVHLEGGASVGKKVAVIGGGNAAVDAARVALRSGAEEVTIVYRRSRKEMPADEEEIVEAEEEGVAIKYLTAPTRVVGKDGKTSGMECVKMELGEPDDSGRRRPIPIKGSEHIIEVDTVIAAISQSPDLSCLAGKDRPESTRWETLVVDPDTMETTVPGVFAAGDVVLGAATVIEAVAGGKNAAESIDRFVRKVDMKEGRRKGLTKVSRLPKPEAGMARTQVQERPAASRAKTFDEVRSGYTEEEALREASRCLSCAVCCECMQCVKACERNAIDHDQEDSTREIEVGSVILATGYDLFDPGGIKLLGYGRYPEVYTSLEFERLNNASGPTSGSIVMRNGKAPKSVAIVHCVGSRDCNYAEYCSKVCCMYSLKFAHLIRDKTGADVYNFYIDIRSGGKRYEEFYKRVCDEEVRFIRGKVVEVTDKAVSPDEKGKLVLVAEDTLLCQTLRVPVDMVILSPAMKARQETEKTARTFGVARDASGFFLEKHPKLAPVETATDGIFIAGTCAGPMDIPETVAQGQAAASSALSLAARGRVQVESATAEVIEELCSGCQTCIELCAYSAIAFDEKKRVSRVNEIVCKGCGTCVAGCPSGAILGKRFTKKQVMAEIEGVLA